MKGSLFILVLQVAFTLGLPVFPCDAQQVVWEKVWGYAPGHEEIHKLTSNGENFLAIGKTSKWLQQIGDFYFWAPVLIKVNQEGDTIFFRRLGTIPVEQIAYLGHKFGNVYQAVIQSPINDNNLPVGYPCILEFTDEGQLLSTKYLTSLPEYRPNTCIKTTDGGLILAGYYNGALSAPTNMMAIKVNFLNELEWSYQYIPPVQNAGYGNRLEKMANGNYLLSGPLGRRIYGYEIDSNGVQVGQKTFYETPSYRVFDMGYASQNWRNTFLSIGGYDSSVGTGNKRKVAIFLKDTLGNKIWGGETVGVPGRIYPNRELSFIYSGWDKTTRWVSRIDKDSNVIWKVNFGTYIGERKVIYDLLFTQPDTGIVAGVWLANSGNLGNQFYLAKIAGVGTAYDPANPGDTVTVSAQEKMFRPKDAPILYPNPTTERIQFKKLTQETLLAIYSNNGKKLMEKAILPNDYVDICELPPGAYLYHLRMGERVFTGKFLKR